MVAQMVKNLPAMPETQVRSLVGEDPLEKEMAIEVNPKLSTDLYFSPLETINLFLKSVNLSFF